MNKIYDTISVCEHCYRHIPAVLFERDNQIWISKTCKTHGDSEHLVEPNSEFYHGYAYEKRVPGTYLIDITNRCNLECPHCYQIPDNQTVDPSIDYILEIIKSWPDNGYNIALAGAEPTMRKDLPDLLRAIQKIPGKQRNIIILSNGVYLAKEGYLEQFTDIHNVFWTIGLNHPDYQGNTVHRKQLEGINNLKRLNMDIKNISYTLEDIDQMEYCLNEIFSFGDTCKQYRIRCGTDIGRSPLTPKVYMSDLVREVYNLAVKNNWEITDPPKGYGNRSHFPMVVNGVFIKIIQWPDAQTIDLKEVQTEAWADLLPGKPPSPLVHQVILRDGAVNKNLPLFDKIPQEYLEKYGTDWN